MCTAAAAGYTDVVHKLVERDASLLQDACHPLYVATQAGQWETLGALLALGADYSYISWSCRTVFGSGYMGVSAKHAAVRQALLDFGVADAEVDRLYYRHMVCLPCGLRLDWLSFVVAGALLTKLAVVVLGMVTKGKVA